MGFSFLNTLFRLVPIEKNALRNLISFFFVEVKSLAKLIFILTTGLFIKTAITHKLLWIGWNILLFKPISSVSLLLLNNLLYDSEP